MYHCVGCIYSEIHMYGEIILVLWCSNLDERDWGLVDGVDIQ